LPKKFFSQTKIRNTGLFSQTNLKTYLGEQNFKEDYPLYVKEELQKIMNWFETNKMVINISKTKFNVFRPRGKVIEPNVGRLVFNNNCVACIRLFCMALVKCSNEGVTGPRHNMKEDPGTSTLIMKREHGQEVPCDPGQVTSILGSTSPPLPPPPPGQPGQNTLPPPFRGHTPPPA